MESNQAAKLLSDLSRMEIDLVHTYDQAFAEIGDPQALKELHRFREQHFKHYQTLSERVEKLGGVSVPYSGEFKRFWTNELDAVVKGCGKEKAAAVIGENERIAARHYEQAALKPFDKDTLDILMGFRRQESRYIEYMHTLRSQ